jgi:hypothetical protein
VTHHNKPELRIIPIRQGKSVDELFGPWQGQVIYHADFVTAQPSCHPEAKPKDL